MAARPAANVPAVALSISSSGNEKSSSSSRSSLAGSMSLLVPFMLKKIVRGMHLRMTKLKIAEPPLFHGLESAVRHARSLSTVDGNCHTGHARGPRKIEDRSCDVVGSRTAVERRAFRLRRKLGIGLAWAWKRRPRRDTMTLILGANACASVVVAIKSALLLNVYEKKRGLGLSTR